jgi:hypothetical protein
MAVVPTVSGVSDFADDILGGTPGVDLTRVGAAAEAFTERVRGLGHDGPVAAMLLATTYWQAFILSPAYERAFGKADVDPALDGRIDRMVVPHPVAGPYVPPRFDLLVFSDAHDGDPVELEARITEDELAAGWGRARDEFFEAVGEVTALTPAHLAFEGFAPLHEAYKNASFRLLLARRPKTMPTAVPSPAWDTRRQPGDADYGSAGLIARDADGVLGVTVANHLFCRDDPAPSATAIGTPVSVRGVRAEVVSSHLITDSCFAALPEAAPSVGVLATGGTAVTFQEPVEAGIGAVTGIASGHAPGNGTELTFTGALSQVKTLVVQGCDPFVYVPSRYVARCVYTEIGTDVGDSGAALLDPDRRAVGFAFERSEYDDKPEWSSWIWAEAVMRAHDLTLLGAPPPPNPPPPAAVSLEA